MRGSSLPNLVGSGDAEEVNLKANGSFWHFVVPNAARTGGAFMHLGAIPYLDTQKQHTCKQMAESRGDVLQHCGDLLSNHDLFED